MAMSLTTEIVIYVCLFIAIFALPLAWVAKNVWQDKAKTQLFSLIGIVAVSVPTARIHLDAVIVGVPAGIAVPLHDHVVRLAIGLKSVPCARASVDCHRRAYECEGNRPRSSRAKEMHRLQ